MIDLNKYQDFVEEITSHESESHFQMYNRIVDVGTVETGMKVNPSLLLTAAIGLAAETGEFVEIPKKVFFQGKKCDEDAIFHMKRELGDIMWYWVTACRALSLDPNDVIDENVKKLKSRYPGGKFDVHHSEKRKKDDI